jgi:hypothetical protein
LPDDAAAGEAITDEVWIVGVLGRGGTAALGVGVANSQEVALAARSTPDAGFYIN